MSQEKQELVVVRGGEVRGKHCSEFYWMRRRR